MLLIDSILPNHEEDRLNVNNEASLENPEDENSFYIEEKVRKLLEFNLKESEKMASSYKPEVYLQKGTVVLLKAEDSIAEYTQKNHARQKAFIPQITVEIIPGSHGGLFDTHHLHHTSHKINECMQRLRNGFSQIVA